SCSRARNAASPCCSPRPSFQPARLVEIEEELGAVIGNDHLGLAAPLDEGRQLAGDAKSGDRSIGHRHQALSRYVIDDVEDREAPSTGELVMDEVERPARIALGLN